MTTQAKSSAQKSPSSNALFSDTLIEPNDLEPRLGADNLILIDLCKPESYQQHHIKGAVNLGYKHLIHGMLPAPGLLPEFRRLQALVNALGISPEKTVVVYDDDGGAKASRMIWVLDCIGHTRYALLNGGIHSWVNEGHPTDITPTRPAPEAHLISVDRNPIADKDYILSILDSSAHLLLDTRTVAEYAGGRGGGLVKGHIPGAINMDWKEMVDRSRHMRLLPQTEILDKLSGLGITPDKEIITYCYTHHRASHTYVLLKYLGFPRVKGYDGAWSEWGNTPGLPVE